MKYTLRSFHPDDAPAIVNNMSPIDRDEIGAVFPGVPLDQAVKDGVARSDQCFTVVDEAGTPLALLGEVSLSPTKGSIWLTATCGLARYPVALLRATKTWMAKPKKRKHLLAIVSTKNTQTIRWLTWAGWSVAQRGRCGSMDSLMLEWRAA